MATSRPERLDMIALACLVEPGTPGIAELVAEQGAGAVLAQVRARRRASRVVGRLDPEQVPGMLAEMTRRGVRVVVPGEAEFPSQLLDLPEPPLALWVRGPLDLRAAALRSVAVVGARACTAYGERATVAVAGGLAADGWAVVSGGAFGIDAAAHRAALGVGGPTIAVLACGVDVAYPRAHDSLLARIGDSGLVVSELPPASQPLKHRFLARNRVIAALSRGTIVVEAARRSGAVSTASRALELGRVVMAVPGPVTSMASSGTNRLLHEQVARAVSDSDEVVSLLTGCDASLEVAGAAAGQGGTDPADLEGLSEEARAVLAALPSRGASSVEVVAERAAVTPAACLAHLGLLEIRGLVRRAGSGWRRCA
jgi:DNA processing protein